jgi:hypothetical protein
MRKEQDSPDEAPVHSNKHELSGPPDFSAPQQPIADFVTRPDFPECLIGKHVMIGGSAGVAVAVVKNSVKVRSAEGFTRSFNVFGLKRIYGPPPELEPLPPPPGAEVAAKKEPPKPAPRPEVITNPDFKQPVVPIAELVKRSDFPRCAFGRRVDIGGYVGVVVELANQSLKVRSLEGTSRSYNSLGLRNIHAQR